MQKQLDPATFARKCVDKALKEYETLQYDLRDIEPEYKGSSTKGGRTAK